MRYFNWIGFGYALLIIAVVIAVFLAGFHVGQDFLRLEPR